MRALNPEVDLGSKAGRSITEVCKGHCSAFERCLRHNPDGGAYPHLTPAGRAVLSWYMDSEHGQTDYPWPGGIDGQPTWWAHLVQAVRAEMGRIRENEIERRKRGRK